MAPAGGREAAGGQAQLRTAAAASDGRAVLRLSHTVTAAGEGLRALRQHSVDLHLIAFACLMLKHAARLTTGS